MGKITTILGPSVLNIYLDNLFCFTELTEACNFSERLMKVQ